MKILYKIKCKEFGTVMAISCTDNECTKLSNTGKYQNLAPLSHGFVNLFDDDGAQVGWCGTSYAKEHRLKKGNL